QGAVNMYGYTESEALKMNIRDMIPEDKIQESQTLIDNAFTGKLFDSLETFRVNRTGKTLKIWVMVLALRDEKDMINGVVTIERIIRDAQ
ncbi:MAG: PAS domain S-box protein, partial [Desulfobacteraceae bacterium]|nr:PAS domain S-box protein [Desulfobacteraceae bacterium]